MVYHLERGVGLHPRITAALLYLHFRGQHDWKVVSGYRSPDDQRADYLLGRDPITFEIVNPSAVVTDADAGQSPHNFGLAVDLQPTYDKGATVSQLDSDPAYSELDALAPKFGLRRISLPSTGRVDSPHMEVIDWESKKSWLAFLAAGAAIVAVIGLVSAA